MDRNWAVIRCILLKTADLPSHATLDYDYGNHAAERYRARLLAHDDYIFAQVESYEIAIDHFTLKDHDLLARLRKWKPGGSIPLSY